jgi:hypothetical protein
MVYLVPHAHAGARSDGPGPSQVRASPSGQLLGAQLVGDHRAEVAKRIDIPPVPCSTP